MLDPYLEQTNPDDYRYAVHCCGYKWDLTYEPDRAVAIFRCVEMAKTYGARMWPTTFEVIDRSTGEKV
ncbi:hypothetical protein D3C84_832580 [compost metagenome]|uniref:hypothetical protein n=1 Tax=Pseudomonas fluorescens TaxID=294 RepID=UPI000FB72710|nr:hypothetical protein [Pseudomonas fluorescens]VVQ20847.1 hypothetical protein PS934_05056 [Pseudomonas fluorescens]